MAFPPPPSPLLTPAESSGSGSGPYMSVTVAVAVLGCIGLFLVISIIKFYAICYGAFMDQQAARERAAASFTTARCELPKGLNEDLIKLLPAKKFRDTLLKSDQLSRPINAKITESEAKDDVGKANDCSVCLGEFEDDENVKELPPCGHVFHVECIDAWLLNRPTCPMCRKSLLPEHYVCYVEFERSWWDVLDWIASGGGVLNFRIRRPDGNSGGPVASLPRIIDEDVVRSWARSGRERERKKRGVCSTCGRW